MRTRISINRSFRVPALCAVLAALAPGQFSVYSTPTLGGSSVINSPSGPSLPGTLVTTNQLRSANFAPATLSKPYVYAHNRFDLRLESTEVARVDPQGVTDPRRERSLHAMASAQAYGEVFGQGRSAYWIDLDCRGQRGDWSQYYVPTGTLGSGGYVDNRFVDTSSRICRGRIEIAGNVYLDEPGSTALNVDLPAINLPIIGVSYERNIGKTVLGVWAGVRVRFAGGLFVSVDPALSATVDVSTPTPTLAASGSASGRLWGGIDASVVAGPFSIAAEISLTIVNVRPTATLGYNPWNGFSGSILVRLEALRVRIRVDVLDLMVWEPVNWSAGSATLAPITLH